MISTLDLQRAEQRARRLYRAVGFRSAYVNGVRAGLTGKPVSECPYRSEAAKTWRSAYRHAWILGWQSVNEGSEEWGLL